MTTQTLVLDSFGFGKGLGPSLPQKLNLEIRPGYQVVVVDRADAAQLFCAALSGETPAPAGQVRLGGKVLQATPALRASIGSLYPEESTALLGDTVEAHLREVARLRGEHQITCGAVDLLLDQEERALPAGQVSAALARRVALCDALSIEGPSVLVVYEPLRDLNHRQQTMVLDLLKQAADQGAIVLQVEGSLRQAERFGATVHDLSTRSESSSALALLLLRVERPREIATRLSAHPSVSALKLDKTRPDELLVSGTSQRALALAAAEALRSARCDVFEMTPLGAAGLSPELSLQSENPSKVQKLSGAGGSS